MDQGAFHRCVHGHVEVQPPASHAGLSLTPPTLCPQAGGKVLWMGIASVTRAIFMSPHDVATAVAMASREQVTFTTSSGGFFLA